MGRALASKHLMRFSQGSKVPLVMNAVLPGEEGLAFHDFMRSTPEWKALDGAKDAGGTGAPILAPVIRLGQLEGTVEWLALPPSVQASVASVVEAAPRAPVGFPQLAAAFSPGFTGDERAFEQKVLNPLYEDAKLGDGIKRSLLQATPEAMRQVLTNFLWNGGGSQKIDRTETLPTTSANLLLLFLTLDRFRKSPDATLEAALAAQIVDASTSQEARDDEMLQLREDYKDRTYGKLSNLTKDEKFLFDIVIKAGILGAEDLEFDPDDAPPPVEEEAEDVLPVSRDNDEDWM
jgi:hypothetical protein